MKAIAIAAALTLVPLTIFPTAVAAAEVQDLMVKDLPEAPGKEAVMLKVEYRPGDKDVAHRHDAHALLYVLEGEIVMQLKGSEPVRLKAGETFYEGPNDVHLIGRNASATSPRDSWSC
jgi:quercetin dioxygenase-like cupin family protein